MFRSSIRFSHSTRLFKTKLLSNRTMSCPFNKARNATKNNFSSKPSAGVPIPDHYLPEKDKFNAGKAVRKMKATEREYFVQDPARIGNAYLEDSVLKDIVKHMVPAELLSDIEEDLIRFGDRVAKEVTPLGHESDQTIPKLLQIDGWGNKIDSVKTSHAWDRLADIATEEGLMGIGYEREKYGEFARVYQFIKMYMFAGGCAVSDCPLAMTNGAIKLVDEADEETRSLCFDRLTTRSIKDAVTSGQWMTERTGGSDVSRAETLARKDPTSTDPRQYELFGYKYFTSSINSQLAFGLARVVNEDGSIGSGSRGLSVFHIETRNEDGQLNNIVVHKLKDKLGTKGVPTAELELRGTKARLVGEPGRGVPVIATLFNITRIHNAISAVSYMRRATAVARDYAYRRTAAGQLLSNNPLHLATLAEMESEFRGALLMLFDSVRWLGESEASKDADTRQRAALSLRLATPLLKLFTGKQAVAVTSEGIEALGAHGYMEDSGVPRLLRDAQVLPIWEGTTNVLALDVLRVASRHPDAVPQFLADAERRAGDGDADGQLAAARRVILDSLQHMAQQKDGTGIYIARHIAYAMSAHYVAALSLEHAARTGLASDRTSANRWLNIRLADQIHALKQARADDVQALRALALDLDQSGQPRHSDGKNVDARGVPRPRL